MSRASSDSFDGPFGAMEGHEPVHPSDSEVNRSAQSNTIPKLPIGGHHSENRDIEDTNHSSSAWFVPEPEDGSAADAPDLSEVVLGVTHGPTTTSTLPTAHIPGIVAPKASPPKFAPPPAPSAWGDASEDSTSLTTENEYATNATSGAQSAGIATRNRLLSTGSNWSSAVPHDHVISPRSSKFALESEIITSPRVSAHRTSRATSLSSKAGPPPMPAAISFGSPLSNSSQLSHLISPRSSSSVGGNKNARDSYGSTSSTMVSGSLPSVGSTVTTNRTALVGESDGDDVEGDVLEMQEDFLDNKSMNGDADYSSASSTVSGPQTSNNASQSKFTLAQRTPSNANGGSAMTIGSVPTPTHLVSPRSSGDHTASSPSSSSSGKIGTGNSAQKGGSGRIPRTKSVALNPMMATIRSGSVSQASSSVISPTNSPSSFSGSNQHLQAQEKQSSPSSPQSHPTPSNLKSSIDLNTLSPKNGTAAHSPRNSVASNSLQGLQSIPAPIAAALKIAEPDALEMKLGGDTHLLEWSWDASNKHNFVKVSSDHSSCTWASSSNYGLARSSVPLKHKKTFVEIAKTRGISQYLWVGLAKPSVDFNCSPAKLQFNTVTVPGEWAGVWIKTSATGDRFGVVYDLDARKLMVHRNGALTYTIDIPASFDVDDVREESDHLVPSAGGASEVEISSSSANGDEHADVESPPTSTSLSAASSSPPPQKFEPIYPFIAMCGDQDILITDMPEFEKYENITWAHGRKNQVSATVEALDGVPAILEMLGLGKLRPKFAGMSVPAFQKLKDADLRKLGTTVEQRRRLLSQIEATK